MITCLVVAAVITCTSTEPKPAPADAVRVLTHSVAPFHLVVPMRRDLPRDVVIRPLTSTMPVPTPTKPLSEPWRVTTVETPDRGTVIWFNGEVVR
jgi:hypothetical protein